MKKPTLARPQETAEHFLISKQTLWRWRKQEGFPQPLQRGSVILFDIDKIMDWLGNKETA